MPWTFSAIMKEAPRLPPNADVAVFRDMVQEKFETRINDPEVGKNNAAATGLRQEGNRFYLAKQYKEALVKYNESICYAETGSEHLAIGYANRSAVYYETGKYEFAVYNIELARKNHCPERLMPKLLKREQNCKEKIDSAPKTVSGIQLQTIKKPNPRIPFLTKGVSMKQLPEFGRALVAERDFEAGDIIFNEKPLLSQFTYSACYSYCSFCGKEFQRSLIPCPNCVYYMYCGKECLEKDKKLTHRFECGVATKLFNLKDNLPFVGAKLFFYGLSVFNDNVQEMMDYCQQTSDKGGNPFSVDYTKYDALAEFKELHKSKITRDSSMVLFYMARDHISRLVTALLYNIYTKTPVVKSIFVTTAQKDFLLRCILRYTELTDQCTIRAHGDDIVSVYPIASIVNHSCDPNALFVVYSGRAKLLLLRPVRQGEQICVSEGPRWWEPSKNYLWKFTCACVVCKPNKRNEWQRTTGKEFPRRAMNDYELLVRIITNENFNRAAKLNATKQFIQRYAYLHPEPNLARVFHAYCELLTRASMSELDLMECAEIATRE